MIITELWNYKQDDVILGMDFGDINGDDSTEIVAYTKGGKIIILTIGGELLFEDVISEDSSIWNAKIFDIDKDGKNELVLGGSDGILRVFKCEKETYELTPVWAHRFGTSISGLVIDDLINDEKPEILAYSLDKTIRVINPDNGDLIWGEIFEDGIGDAVVWKNDSLALYLKEVIACGNDGTLRVYNAKDGDLLWFKKYTDKIRCVAGLNSEIGAVVLCGGDDKLLHFIEKGNQKEILTMDFDDFVWKLLSYPDSTKNKALVSSYSFAFFDESIPIEEIKFTSKITCINEHLTPVWNISGKNVEYIKIMEKQETLYVLAGTTVGEILIIDADTGEIFCEENKKSCTNMVKALPDKNLLFSCHDDGYIYAYFLEDY